MRVSSLLVYRLTSWTCWMHISCLPSSGHRISLKWH